MFCLSTVKRGSPNGGESYEKYRNPALFDRKSGVTTSYPAFRLDAVCLTSFFKFNTQNAFQINLPFSTAYIRRYIEMD